ncbi:MAG: 3',5'-cyclic-nucleotide phosphodiesterase [Rhodospirillales bacterium]|nr:3',5'-cyclic-nucleotide phosphodiesterase [Alphaproteobacteria bacterium]MBL6947255.1 3',5'-cyclic-nucleotide phosphodiesterase [Rhodospirillales bacterium]
MRFQVLGCSGSIGDHYKTTSFLIDDDILLDAGSGLGTLALDSLRKIDHVFLSHSHLDHIALLPMLVDATLSLRDKPIVVRGIEPTLETLSEHIFNWKVYPDFRKIFSMDHAAVKFEVLEPGTPVAIDSRSLTAIPVEHSVPTVGYHLSGGTGSLVVATDMTVSEGFWPIVNAIDDLRYLLIETAFQNSRLNICKDAGHLCPSLLGEELRKLERAVEIFIVHTKPSAKKQIQKEISALDSTFEIRMLADGDVLEF